MCEQFQTIPLNLVEVIKENINLEKPLDFAFDKAIKSRSIHPRSEAPVMYSQDGYLQIQSMKWGYEVPWSSQVFFNTYVEQAIKEVTHNMWYDSLCDRRCVVPALGFVPTNQTTLLGYGSDGDARYLFTLSSKELFYIAGIFEMGQFSIMMTESTPTLRQFNKRMPVVLSHEEITTWLDGDYEKLFDRRHIQLNAQRIGDK